LTLFFDFEFFTLDIGHRYFDFGFDIAL
jgi:hypothetical protein